MLRFKRYKSNGVRDIPIFGTFRKIVVTGIKRPEAAEARRLLLPKEASSRKEEEEEEQVADGRKAGTLDTRFRNRRYAMRSAVSHEGREEKTPRWHEGGGEFGDS